MWDTVAVISFLAFIIAVVGTAVCAVKHQTIWKKWLAAVGVAFVIFAVGAANASPSENPEPPQTAAEQQNDSKEDINNNETEEKTPQQAAQDVGTPSGTLKVHFLNVGQGDSILIQFPDGQVMLVDAGTNESGSSVISYLKSQGVNKINYLVATHPHSDHIGGMASVVQGFDIGKVYMPRVNHTTKTYENLLLAIKAKGLKITSARAGTDILDQDSLKAGFVAPCSSSYDDLNNYSAVVRIQYGNNTFLLTGDAESESEQQMLAGGANLKADVLKVGHHGSRSSTTKTFLKSVSPKYAVISLGAGNTYGHPHQVTLDKLTSAGVQTYRTDKHGTVIFTSDGKTLTIKTLGNTVQPRAPDNKAAAAAPAPTKVASPTPAPAQTTDNYIGNKTTKKFHRSTCSTLPAENNRVYYKSRDEAVAAGYVPCKRCNP